LPTAFLTVVKVSNDRMRGSRFSSCKISLMFCRDLRADRVPLTGAHKADLSAVNVVAQTSILSSDTKGILMTEHAKYPFSPDNIQFGYKPNAHLEPVATVRRTIQAPLNGQ
jgi:hypothetical protein